MKLDDIIDWLHAIGEQYSGKIVTLDGFSLDVEDVCCEAWTALEAWNNVVYCKECKHWWKENCVCTHDHHCNGNVCVHVCSGDDFCSDGERK